MRVTEWQNILFNWADNIEYEQWLFWYTDTEVVIDSCWSRNQHEIDLNILIHQSYWTIPLITAFGEMVKTDEWMKSQISQLAKETYSYLQNTFNVL